MYTAKQSQTYKIHRKCQIDTINYEHVIGIIYIFINN